MNNSNVKINEILLSMISFEPLENIKKYYIANKKLIDFNYQNNKIINDSILYERMDVIEWLSTFVKIFELPSYKNYIEQCVFMNNVDLLQWFYNYNSAFFSDLTNNEDNLSKYENCIKQCISTDNIDLLRWFYNFTLIAFTNLINKNDDIFLFMCQHNAIKCWDLIKTVIVGYNVKIEENVIVDKWKNNDVLFYIFYETAEERSDWSNTSCFSSENWYLRQILKIEDTENLIKKLDLMTDKEFMPSTCGMFDKTIIDSSKRNSKHCTHKINAKISNFDSLVKPMCKIENLEKSFKKTYDFNETTIFSFKNSKILLDEQFEVIKYNIGGKFDMHVDSKQNMYHNHTLLLFPPQKIEGGELIVKYGYCDSMVNKQTEKIIKPHENLWTIVLFPIGVFHASKPVLSGEKITLKGTAYINNIHRIKVIEERVNYGTLHSYGLADGSYRRNYSNKFYDEKSCWKDDLDLDDVINATFVGCDEEW